MGHRLLGHMLLGHMLLGHMLLGHMLLGRMMAKHKIRLVRRIMELKRIIQVKGPGRTIQVEQVALVLLVVYKLFSQQFSIQLLVLLCLLVHIQSLWNRCSMGHIP
jgi:hypothetical protein